MACLVRSLMMVLVMASSFGSFTFGNLAMARYLARLLVCDGLVLARSLIMVLVMASSLARSLW